ncbi:SPFH domain-containing protein [Streptomyces sp. NPDC002773]|uniref:SPFH domain-containing protein n=1 Tax=Streptomyces sp. NPDC002773 TaxID=3154430 RepID=UPI00331D7DDE
MTASTPNPADSGAAASRDAARTARRLTDGKLPRTTPPHTSPPSTPPPHEPEAGGAEPPVSEEADARPPAPEGAAASPAEGVRAPVMGAPISAPGEAAESTPGGAPVLPQDAEPAPQAEAPNGGAGPAGTPPGQAAVRPWAAPEHSAGSAPADLAGGSGALPVRGAGPEHAAAPADLAGGSGALPVRGAGPEHSAAPADLAGGPGTPPAQEAGPTGGLPTGHPDGSGSSAPTVRPAGSADVSAVISSGIAGRSHTRPAGPASGASVNAAEAASGPSLAHPAGSAPDAQVSPAPAPDGAVVAAVRVVRRKNVIGAETTGSIPVHLLFRDEPDTVLPLVAGEDDGGPDTVAMAPPVPVKGPRHAAPKSTKVQAAEAGLKSSLKPLPKTQTKEQSEAQAKVLSKTLSKAQPDAPAGSRSNSKAPAPTPVLLSRPAPTADPDLVERSAQVLPGWVGVAGGALALAGCAAVVWWAGAVPAEAARMLRLPERPYHGIHLGQWALLALGVVLTLFALGGLGRGRVGYAWVLTLFGDYRGTVRRTGLVWVSPLLLRRRVDVRLRHWRSEPLSSVDAKGTALDVTVLVVWRVRDTVRAALGVDGHEDYLREQVEAAMARVLSQLPADAFHEDAPTLRDAEAVGEALTRMLSAECAPVGVDVFSAQPTRIEYAPEVAAAMRRRRIAAIDAKHRDSVLTSVVDAVDDVVHRLTSRGLVELDDYERKALVKDLTVAFYTGRTGPVEGA